MKRTLAYFCCLFCLTFVTATVKAQVSVGTPRFSSFGGGPFDSVNLGNLDVHFVIPIVKKAGRGLNFNYNLTYDGLIWQPVTSNGTTSWQNSAVTTWGWTSSIARGGGQVIARSISIDQEQCMKGGAMLIETTVSYSQWTYYDGLGTQHPFSGTSTKSSGCTSNTTGFSATATDDSGYSVTIQGAGATALTAVDGTKINPNTGAISVTDTNGNEITSSTNSSGATVYTDTLGTSALTVSGSPTSSPVSLQYTSPSGGSPAYTVNYTSYTVKTAFGFSTIKEYGPTANPLVSSIQLPDNTSYSFTYEQTPGSCTPLSGTFSSYCTTGRLASITLPTGGTVNYLYTGGTNGTGIFADGSISGLTRILAASTTCSASTSCWQYSRSLVSGSPGAGSTWITTVVDPNGNNTVVNLAEDSVTATPTNNVYETQRQVYQGSVSGNACSATTTNNCLLSTTIRCYNANFANCSTATVSTPITQLDVYSQLPNGSTRLSQIVLNGVGLVTDDKEYDYGVTLGSAPAIPHLVRETATTYALFNRPHTVVVSDWTSGAAVTLGSSTYTYDQSTPTSPSVTTPQHVSVTGSRGNLTTLQTFTSSSASLTRTFTYYNTGTPNVVTDVNGAQTTYVYGIAAQGNTTVSCGNSFPTQINEPLGLARSFVWNCSGGVTTQATDENSNSAASAYSDPDFWRPASVTDQMNNQSNFSYFGQTSVEAALQNFNGGASASDGRTTVDGFGRPILSQRLQGPTSSSYDTTETDYNNVGLPSRTTMPFSATAGTTNSSAPSTTRTYDALGRVLTIKDASNGQVAFTYTNNDVKQSITGTQSFQKQFEYDGLGRLTSVCEMTQLTGSGTCAQSNGVSGYWTKYTYDALGHLLTVTQDAQAATGGQQTRTFVYDMLGRVTSESNPETGNNGTNGTITYTYDSIASCGGKAISSSGDLVQKTDNATNVTCYTYDGLHRMLTEGNSTISGATLRSFVYDTKASFPSGVTISNGKARMIEAQTTNTSGTIITDEYFSYSPRGELTDVYESTPHSVTFYHTTAAYWPTGALKTLSGIPGVPTINYGANGTGLDPEGRITQVTASSGPNPVTSVSYSAVSTTNFLGALTGVTFGSQDSDSFTYDPNTARMLTYTFNVNGKTDAGTLTWNSNGTLASLAITDQIPGTSDSQSCSYAYDDLQRLSSVNCGTLWSQTFTYDPFGNITKSGSSAFAPSYLFSGKTTNQFFSIPGVSVSYDKNGNLLVDNLNSYTWDPNWGNMLSVANGSVTVNAIYDALGRMVEKNQNGTFTEFIYGATGVKLAAASGQTLVKAFIALPGGAKAVYTPAGLAYYRHSDWLGSSRLASTQARALFSSTAYAPFGEQYATAGTADGSFTGQDQDTVSTLYDFPARRHSPSQGRWISPDPLGRGAVTLTNPQTWNRYAYVNNNPLRLIDPMGMCDDNPEKDTTGDANGDCSDDDGGSGDGGSGDAGGDGSDGCTDNGDGSVTCPGETVTVTADAGPNPCVVFVGGTGDGDYDSAFTTAAAATGTAVYITSYPGFMPTELADEAYDAAPGLSATPCGGRCQDVSAQINALEQANPQGLLLIPFSAGALPVNQGAGSGALNTTGINGILYFSPGSPAGYAPELNSIPTFTYWGSGTTNSLVYAANGAEFNGGGITPTYSGLPPGFSATIPNCDHDFGCEYGGSGLGNTLQSDCNPSTSENRSDDDQNKERFAVRPKDSDGDKGIAEVDTWPARDQRGQL